MAINNLSKTQLDPETAETLQTSLQGILDKLNPLGKSLTSEERRQFGSINERNKLITIKALDFHRQQPALQSPDVDWKAFDLSWETRSALVAIENLCYSILEVASDNRIIHDFDLYQMTLTDYDYTKYKAESTAASGGYTFKFAELKQFFGSTGGSKPKEEPKETVKEEGKEEVETA